MRYLLLLLLMMGVTPIFGQLILKNGVIAHYRDGSIFVGQYLEEDNTTITMIATTGDTIHLNKYLIRKFFGKDDIELYTNGQFHNTSKYFWRYDYEAGGNNNGFTIHQSLIFGTRLKSKIDIGIGIGFCLNESIIDPDFFTTQYLTTFGYGRYLLWKGKIRPYASLKAGYGIGLSPDYSGGLYIQPGIDVVFKSRTSNKLSIGLGQQFLHTKGQAVGEEPLSSFPVTYDFDLWLRRLVLRVGLDF